MYQKEPYLECRIDADDMRRLIDTLLVVRDDCPSGDPVVNDLWLSAVDRATYGMAVLWHLLAGSMTADMAAQFLSELETDPDGIPGNLIAYLER